MYDIIIVGGGPAGLTAAIYGLRAGKTVLVIEKNSFGGQIAFSPKVENIPGTKLISGAEFADRLTDQAMALGADVELEKVVKLEKDGDIFKVYTEEETVHEGKSVNSTSSATASPSARSATARSTPVRKWRW